MSRHYEKPAIKTLRADEIVESMGPVSCGSGAQTPLPVASDVTTGGRGGSGYSELD